MRIKTPSVPSMFCALLFLYGGTGHALAGSAKSGPTSMKASPKKNSHESVTESKAGGDKEGDLPFAVIAERFIETQDLSLSLGNDKSLGQIVSQGFISAQLGLFTVKYPIQAIGEKGRSEQLIDLCAALLEAQATWVRWATGTAPKKPVEDLESLETLQNWIGSINGRELNDFRADSPSKDLFEFLEAPDDVKEAAARFQEYMTSVEYFALNRKDAPTTEVVLLPTRREFVGFACAVGQAVEAARDMLWTNTIDVWTDFKWGEMLVLALEYATPEGDLDKSIPMDSKEKTGVFQHVLHHAMLQICDSVFGEFLDPAVESGLAINLVISIYGENNARVGGSGAVAKTSARSKFVVGGRSSGGKLPGINADSTWRDTKGKDYFIRAIKRGFKDGMKEAKSSGIFVALRTQDGRDVFPAQAPFLGEAPGSPTFDESFTSDAMEFFRAYGSAFTHWLQEQKSKQSSRETFAQLLKKCAEYRAAREGDFAAAISEVYGIPLTSSPPDGTTMEGRFLRAIAR